MSIASCLQYARSRGFFHEPELPSHEKAVALSQLPHGMTPDEVVNVCERIEKEETQWKKDGIAFYLPRQTPSLLRSLEYDPLTNLKYVHLKKHGIKAVGEGCSKDVTLSILYNRMELVAHVVTIIYSASSDSEVSEDEARNEDNAIAENALLQELNGLTGIVKTYTFSPKRTLKNGDIQYARLQKYYNGGDLAHFSQDKVAALSLKQKIDIAKDLIEGLMHIHDRGISHRDMSCKNYLVHFEKAQNSSSAKASAAIVDFEYAYRPYKNIEKQKRQEVRKREWEEVALTSKTDDEDTLRIRARMQNEISQDSANKPIGHYEFKADTIQLGTHLLDLFFLKNYVGYYSSHPSSLMWLKSRGESYSRHLPVCFASQQERHELEDRMQQEETPFSFDDQFRFILLKMLCWSDSHAYTPKQAFEAIHQLAKKLS